MAEGYHYYQICSPVSSSASKHEGKKNCKFSSREFCIKFEFIRVSIVYIHNINDLCDVWYVFL